MSSPILTPGIGSPPSFAGTQVRSADLRHVGDELLIKVCQFYLENSLEHINPLAPPAFDQRFSLAQGTQVLNVHFFVRLQQEVSECPGFRVRILGGRA